jgi:hypothetical protein
MLDDVQNEFLFLITRYHGDLTHLCHKCEVKIISWATGIQFPARVIFLSSSQRSDQILVHPASYPKTTRVYFPGNEAAGA